MNEIMSWLTSQGLHIGSLVIKAVLIAIVGYVLIRMAVTIVENIISKSNMEKAAHSLIITLTRTVLYVLLALVLASSLGIDVTGIVALASVVTLAISLALQDMLSNIVGGFTLLYTHPFSSGDFVEIASQSGVVKEIGMTYTKLQTGDNKLISIPNKAVVSAEIVNYSVTGTRRVSIDVSASYDAPAQLVMDTLVACADMPEILSEPAAPAAMLMSYGDSVINYQLRYWVNSGDYWSTYFAINAKIKIAFDAAGIEMSYPHLNVHLDK